MSGQLAKVWTQNWKELSRLSFWLSLVHYFWSPKSFPSPVKMGNVEMEPAKPDQNGKIRNKTEKFRTRTEKFRHKTGKKLSRSWTELPKIRKGRQKPWQNRLLRNRTTRLSRTFRPRRMGAGAGGWSSPPSWSMSLVSGLHRFFYSHYFHFHYDCL